MTNSEQKLVLATYGMQSLSILADLVREIEARFDYLKPIERDLDRAKLLLQRVADFKAMNEMEKPVAYPRR